MRPSALPLLAALLPLALAAAPRRKAKPARARAASSPVPARPDHPPGPPPVAAGSGGSGVSAALNLLAGPPPLKPLGSQIYFLYPGEAQPLSATFVSGLGAATKIISLNYRIMKVKPASAAAPLEIELIPPGEKSGRKVTLFTDGRPQIVTLWHRESPERKFPDEDILLELKPASPGESAAVAWRTPPTMGRTFRIRAQLTQALPAGDKMLESSDFIAPLGDSARTEYENLTVRVETRAATAAAAQAPLPAQGAAPAPPEVRAVGDSRLFVDPPADQLPAAPRAPPSRSSPGAGGGAPAGAAPAGVTVEDRDHLRLKISAEPAENHRLRYTVFVEGTLAALLGEPVPLHLSRVFSGYRHETASLIIAAPGGRYQYSLSLDPDWQEEGSEAGAIGGK